MSFPPERFFLGTPLDLGRAIARGDLASARLLAPGVDLRTPGAEAVTLPHYAWLHALGGEPERLAILTAVVARDPGAVHVPHPEAGTVLEGALMATKPMFLEALLDGGVSPDVTVGDTGTPALMFAPRDVCLENLRLLLDRGADVNARDLRGSTALLRATYELQADVIELLLQRGADPRVVDRGGVSFRYALSNVMERQRADAPIYLRLLAVRDRFTRAGLEPPAPPEVERERMRERGEDPLVPLGHTR